MCAHWRHTIWGFFAPCTFHSRTNLCAEIWRKTWKTLYLQKKARCKTRPILSLKPYLSLTHSVLNMFCDQRHTVSSVHVMSHSLSGEPLCALPVIYSSCYILNFLLTEESLGLPQCIPTVSSYFYVQCIYYCSKFGHYDGIIAAIVPCCEPLQISGTALILATTRLQFQGGTVYQALFELSKYYFLCAVHGTDEIQYAPFRLHLYTVCTIYYIT